MPVSPAPGQVAGILLIGLAVVFGGGSALFPSTRMLVEVAGAGVLAWHAALGWRAPVDRWSAAAIGLLGLVLLLPLVQLVPLPPAWWQALPGRDDAAAIMRATGMASRWMPISLQPDETRGAAAFLIAPVAMFVATLHADTRTRLLLGWIVVAGALAGALLGLLQAGAGAGAGLFLYNTAHRGAALGLFANKNHHADMLLVGILLAAALTRVSATMGLWAPARLATAGAIAVMAVTLPATNSRMGLLLTPVALVPAALLLLPPGTLGRGRRGVPMALVLVAGLAAAAAAVAVGSGVVGRLVDRFGGDPDARLRFWPDVLFAIRHYQPVGAGLGGFVKIFQRDESLATLDFTYVVHAHNDLLEIALDAGWAGVALVAAAGALLAWAGWRLLRPAAWSALTPLHLACLLAIVILAAHSLVDYPLRTLTLASTLAFLAGCLAPAPAVGPARTAVPAPPGETRP